LFKNVLTRFHVFLGSQHFHCKCSFADNFYAIFNKMDFCFFIGEQFGKNFVKIFLKIFLKIL